MSDKEKRWYCYVDDELVDCPGRNPEMYDPGEYVEEHDSCGWVSISGRFVHPDWKKRFRPTVADEPISQRAGLEGL